MHSFSRYLVRLTVYKIDKLHSNFILTNYQTIFAYI